MAHTRSFSTYFADITAFLLLSGLNFIFDSLASNTWAYERSDHLTGKNFCVSWNDFDGISYLNKYKEKIIILVNK